MSLYQVGDRIREARKKIGLNQEELAELARLNRVTVAKYESGKVEPGAQALSRIADALEVTVDQLLGRDPLEGQQSQQITPKTIEARILAQAVDQMTKEERERALEAMKLIFVNYTTNFEKGTQNDDT